MASSVEYMPFKLFSFPKDVPLGGNHLHAFIISPSLFKWPKTSSSYEQQIKTEGRFN